MLQDYATEYYGLLFFILVLVLMYQMGTGRSIFYTGVIGSLLMLSFANFLAAVRMRRKIVAVTFEDELFYPINAFDQVFGNKTRSFPIAYASPKWNPAGLEIVYHDSILLLKREEWPNLNEVYHNFFIQSAVNST